VIRQQMEETRADLAAKLETLEQQVVDTVTGTTAAVTQTVENVKEAVQETVDKVKDTVQGGVESVKNAFDLSAQMDRHPWLLMAGSVAVGYWGGLAMQHHQPRHRGHRPYGTSGRTAGDVYSTRNAMSSQSAVGMGDSLSGASAGSSYAASSQTETHSGLLGTLASEFGQEFNKLKAVAIGTGLGLIRDFVSQSIPESLKPRVTEIVNNVTTKLGGEVVQGPIWQGEETAFGSHRSNDHAEGTMGGAYRANAGSHATSRTS